MLRTLHIRDFVIVDRAEIQFDHGFTVFSGETGAGKSILVDALALALGARADTGVLREGAQRTDITAVFEPPPAACAWLSEHEFDSDDVLVLRRVVDVQGRSRAFINGVPVNLGQIREVGEFLVDIHGQHSHQSLLRSASQRDLLDAQGGLLELARAVQHAWHDWQQAERVLSQARLDASRLEQERERLEWQLADIDQLDPQDGEWEQINTEQSRLAHGQALLEGATQALAALDDDEASARRLLSAAEQRLRPLLRHDSGLQGAHQAIESAEIAISEAVSDLNSYLARLELDPERLAATEERLSGYFDLARKHKIEPEELVAHRENLRRQLQAHDQAADVDTLMARVETAREHYETQAAELTRKRRETSETLSAQVTEAMQALAMEGGSFKAILQPGPPSSHGAETVEFRVAGHAGTQARPLSKVASGGELARLSLALSVIASRAARVPTLIFDEVDTGIGGGVAEIVGRLLRELGQRHQVLCVTHLPQVAAQAGHHYEVRKSTRDGSTISEVHPLDEPARIDEIARMLGGLTITETTRRHAFEMLKG